jgi:hypothetical protein
LPIYDITLIDADPNHPIKTWAEGGNTPGASLLFRTPKRIRSLSVIAEGNNFTSRQAPKPAKKAEPRKPRIHRTGLNVQFNTKATPETIAKFYRLADEKKITLGELFEMAVDALER